MDFKEMADKVADGAKDLAEKAADAAKDLGEGAKDVAGKAADGAKEGADKAADVAKDLADKAGDVAKGLGDKLKHYPPCPDLIMGMRRRTPRARRLFHGRRGCHLTVLCAVQRRPRQGYEPRGPWLRGR